MFVDVGLRDYEHILKDEIPKSMATKYTEYQELIQAVLRLTWRKNYELMIPVVSLG